MKYTEEIQTENVVTYFKYNGTDNMINNSYITNGIYGYIGEILRIVNIREGRINVDLKTIGIFQ